MHAPTGVAGFQGEQERSGRRSRRAHVQHWVGHNWEAIHMVGKNYCFAQHEARLYFPMLLIPDQPCPGLDDLFDSHKMGELDLPKRQR